MNNLPDEQLVSLIERIDAQLDQDPRSEETLQLLAQASDRAGQLGLIKEDPLSLKLLFLRGLRAHLTGDTKGARRDFDEVVRYGQGVAGAEGTLFSALMFCNDPLTSNGNENEQELALAYGLLPEVAAGTPLLFQAVDMLARMLSRPSPDKARTVWEKRIQLAAAGGDEMAVIHSKVQLAMHFQYFEKDPARALAIWEDIVASQERSVPEQRHPMYSSHLRSLASARLAAGAAETAMEPLQKAKESHGIEPQTLWTEAGMLREQKKFSEAAAVYRRLLELYRKMELTTTRPYSDAWISIADILESDLNDLSAALAEWQGVADHYRKMIQAGPVTTPAWDSIFQIFAHLAGLHIRLDQYAEAKAVAEEALGYCNTYWNDTPRRIPLWSALAVSKEHSGDMAGAADEWDALAGFIADKVNAESPDIPICRKESLRMRGAPGSGIRYNEVMGKTEEELIKEAPEKNKFMLEKRPRP